MGSPREDAAAEREQLLDAAAAAYFHWDHDGAYDLGGEFCSNPDALYAALHKLPDVTLRALAEEAPRLSARARSHVATAVGAVAAGILRNPGFSAGQLFCRDVGDAIVLAEVLDALHTVELVSTSPRKMDSFMRAFERAAPWPDERRAAPVAGLLATDRETQLDAAAFIVAEYVGLITRDFLAETPVATLEAIRRHIHDPHRVVTLLDERRTLDPEVVVPLLDADSVALAGGIL